MRATSIVSTEFISNRMLDEIRNIDFTGMEGAPIIPMEDIEIYYSTNPGVVSQAMKDFTEWRRRSR